jgi:hypothetical protein
MADVLRVAAFEVGDPIAAIVLVESGDFAVRPRRWRCWRFMQF